MTYSAFPSRPFLPCLKALQAAKNGKGILDAALSISHKGEEIYRTATHENTDALYDLASLTKTIAGLTLFLIGKEKGLWTPEDRIREFLPGAEKTLGAVTLRELLAHESGLPAWRDYFPLAGREAVLHSVLGERPGEKKPVYSDLGYMALTHIMETVTGRRVDRLWEAWGRREKWSALQYSGNLPGSPGTEIIPTENAFHRKGLLSGIVNDDNCFRMDSVSAHAGLFGNLSGIRDWFWSLHKGEIVPQSLVLETLECGNSEFYCGWMKKSEKSPNLSGKFSRQTYGMLGFTGCSFFYDPQRKLLAILLASRVRPTHDATEIRRLRRSIYEGVIQGLEKL